MTGLSNQAQALLVLAAGILISIGALATAIPSAIPQPLNWYLGFALMIIGSIGLAIKEYLGILTQSSTTTTTTKSATTQ